MLLLHVFGAGLVGQLLKVLFHSIREKRWRLVSFVDVESFPSLHPVLGGSLVYQLGMVYGWDSALAGIAGGFVGVIIYDTSGMKRAAGRQARILVNVEPRHALENALNVLLGQSPVRTWIAVISGAMLSIFVERAVLALTGLN
jgi:uncharacterized protein